MLGLPSRTPSKVYLSARERCDHSDEVDGAQPYNDLRGEVTELIRLGQREWLNSITELYEGANDLLGRDVRAGYIKLLQGETP